MPKLGFPPRPSLPHLPKEFPRLAQILKPATTMLEKSHEAINSMQEDLTDISAVIRGPASAVRTVAKTLPALPRAEEKTANKETVADSIAKPSTEETIAMLEARLNESLVALQPDLLDGARINGKPCDCIKKHTDEMLAAVRELQSMASKPIYSKIRTWAAEHNWDASVVAKHPPQFFIDLVPELRALRKELNQSEPENCPRCEKVKTATEFLREKALKKARGDKEA